YRHLAVLSHYVTHLVRGTERVEFRQIYPGLVENRFADVEREIWYVSGADRLAVDILHQEIWGRVDFVTVAGAKHSRHRDGRLSLEELEDYWFGPCPVRCQRVRTGDGFEDNSSIPRWRVHIEDDCRVDALLYAFDLLWNPRRSELTDHLGQHLVRNLGG